MKSKYRKVSRKSRKIMAYAFIGILFISCNIISVADILLTNLEINRWRIVVLVSSLIAECLGLLYCLVQDLSRTYTEVPTKFALKNHTDSIPFVDREELLRTILDDSLEKVRNKEYYYTKNIRYGVHNGKKAFARKLCLELQAIKDGKSYQEYADLASKLGNIIYIDYAKYAESFDTLIKTEPTFIRGKKNIVVVNNSYEDYRIWTDDLADKDVFYIFLNYNLYSEDALFFANDKIEELLKRLRNMPVFAPICANKTADEIREIAMKLGKLSNNNIGTIVTLLTSNEFNMLLETDKHFIDFYFAIRHGKYSEAVELYNRLPEVSRNDKVLYFKIKYEAANLAHFLGNYSDAYEKLEMLLTELFDEDEFKKGTFGKNLYMDIILLQAHVKKHQGFFDTAALILQQVGESQRNLNWLRSHFSINILQLNEIKQSSDKWNKLLQDLADKMKCFYEIRKTEDSDFYFYEAYYPVARFYKSGFDKTIIPDLIKIEDIAISYYEKEERRYLTNCYYIKAELYRISEDWKAAEEFYNRCYNICCHNGDKDILYLVAIVCKHLQCFEGITLNIPFNWEATIAECENQEEYDFHKRLISQMKLADKGEMPCEYWIQHYRTTINPIP